MASTNFAVKNPENSRTIGYSKLNKLEESSSFRRGGVEKQKGILAVIYKKELVCKHLRETSGRKSWHDFCLYFYMVIMA